MAIEVVSVHERRRPRIIKGVSRAVQLGTRAAALRQRRIILHVIAVALVISLAAFIAFIVYSYNSYAKLVDARLASGYLTSRAGIYAAPRTLRVGQTLSRERLITLLRRAGYIESSASDVWSGSFTAQANFVEIRPRHLSDNSPAIVRVRFNKNNRIVKLESEPAAAGPFPAYTLEPEVLTTDATMKAGQRVALAYRDIPPVLVRAILAIEDRRFFEHRGIDLFGIGRALLRNAGSNEVGHGGSTITQQLVKNTYLSPERTLRRKFAEAMISFTVERRLSKEDIFALYCNEIYLGQRGAIGVRGVDQAARVYFGKDLQSLTLAEAATIAGMIQSPNRYSPDRHAENLLARRNTVIAAMQRDGAITQQEAAAASNEPLTVIPAKDGEDSVAPYFIDYVNRVVESQLEASSQTDERGLRVYTTIDPDLQEIAETATKRQLERLDKIYRKRGVTPQAALVALDPKTGDVLALVGGRNYADSQLNRVTDALRQPGSVFKPFVYAAALESGISPVSTYADTPREFLYDRNRIYRPANYGGAFSMHDVTMRTGLVKSLNVVTVDIALRTGLSRVASMAEKFGLPKPQPYPALALGTTEATPLQIAAAYTAFANNGLRVPPRVIAHATDVTGMHVIGSSERPEARQVIKPTTAYMMTDMLAGVIDHGTARAAHGAVKQTAIAGKTGTSRDGWFAGYTPNLVCVVWIGFDDNKQLGLTGAEAALPAWTEFVKGAVELRPELGGEKFTRPAGITFIEIDPETGLLATDACPQRERIAITSALAPHNECFTHSEALQFIASAGEEEYYDAETDAAGQRDNAYSAPSAVTSNTRRLPPPPVTSAGVIEVPSLRTTVVATDARGQRTLTNVLRGGASTGRGAKRINSQ